MTGRARCNVDCFAEGCVVGVHEAMMRLVIRMNKLRFVHRRGNRAVTLGLGRHAGLPLRNGEGESDLRAFAEFARRADLAAVQGDELAGDGKAESGAAVGAGTRFVGAIETFEDVRQCVGWDAGAGVVDSNLYTVFSN